MILDGCKNSRENKTYEMQSCTSEAADGNKAEADPFENDT